MKARLSFAVAFMAVLVFGAMPVSAALTPTFVPAVDGVNSFQSIDGTSAFSSTTATNGLWHDRVGTFDIVGLDSPLSGAYQGQDRGAVQTHNEVVTTLTGLTPGVSYDITMVHGVTTSSSGGNQDIDAGFTSGSLTTLLESNSTLTGDFLQAGGGTGPWSVAEQLIGSTVADGSGEIKVYVGATLNGERSIYNGLSYTETVPEPASAMLLGLGLIGFVALRRRQK